MVASGDYIQVIDEQKLAGVSKPILNVYYLEVTAIAGTPVINNMGAAFQAWINTWLFTSMLPVQSNQLTHVKLTVNNLSAYETEFLERTYSTAYQGGVVSDYTSSAVTWSFQLVRLNRTTRNGRKGVAGVPESLTTANAATAGAVALLNTLASAMSGPPPVDDGGPSEISVRLVIPKTPTPPATLPTVFNPVTTVAYRGIGTQTTRKELLP